MSDPKLYTEDDPYLARPILAAWMAHIGYPESAIGPVLGPPDHRSFGCEFDGVKWDCLNEEDESRHPDHDETAQVAEIVMFTLEALDAAGRLLPPGGETREEWGVHRAGEEWDYTPARCRAPRCSGAAEHGHRFRRTVTTFPDGGTFTSAWETIDA